MDMFDDLQIPVQHQINTAIYDECPDIPERIRSRNDEFLGHGYTNSEEQGGLSEQKEKDLIAKCTATITKHEGKAPTGWMSPWLSNSETTMDLLQEAGYRYVMDWTMDDQPTWIKTRGGKILSMPYPVEANDNRGIVWYRYTSSEFTDMLIDNFDEMLEQTQRDGHPLVCPISLHPFVVGRPYRIRQLRRALEHILKYKDRIWLTRPGDICQHIETLPEGTVPTS
jgi:peptidoglycan/xylan/chitin deacetylase (PgdA/CDA1 family)